jgi:hypothetical protein
MKASWIFVILFAIIVGSYYLMVSSKDWSVILPTEPVNPNPELAEQFQTWVDYKSPDGTYKVFLPVVPQTATEDVNARIYQMAVSQAQEGTVYMVSSISFPEKIDLKILTVLMDEMTSNKPDNTVSMTEDGSYKGNPTLSFQINGKEKIINVKEILVGQTVYMLSRITDLKKKDEEAYSYFLNSFELLEK